MSLERTTISLKNYIRSYISDFKRCIKNRLKHLLRGCVRSKRWKTVCPSWSSARNKSHRLVLRRRSTHTRSSLFVSCCIFNTETHMKRYGVSFDKYSCSVWQHVLSNNRRSYCKDEEWLFNKIILKYFLIINYQYLHSPFVCSTFFLVWALLQNCLLHHKFTIFSYKAEAC